MPQSPALVVAVPCSMHTSTHPMVARTSHTCALGVYGRSSLAKPRRRLRLCVRENPTLTQETSPLSLSSTLLLSLRNSSSPGDDFDGQGSESTQEINILERGRPSARAPRLLRSKLFLRPPAKRAPHKSHHQNASAVIATALRNLPPLSPHLLRLCTHSYHISRMERRQSPPQRHGRRDQWPLRWSCQ